MSWPLASPDMTFLYRMLQWGQKNIELSKEETGENQKTKEAEWYKRRKTYYINIYLRKERD